MTDLATIPFTRVLPKDWNVATHAGLQIVEHAPKGAVLVKVGRRVDIATLALSAKLQTPSANRWIQNADSLWLWQGPREWLVISEAMDGPSLAQDLARVFDGITVLTPDVTDRTLRLRISGSCAPAVFAKGTSLNESLLPTGACCRTRFANLHATVLRSDAGNNFSLITDRSTAVYLHTWLTRAAQDVHP